jgi:NADPH:quinone reductase-like Zn-dependent oxidoreductase
MNAIRIHGCGGPDHLVYEEVPNPRPGPGEVLVRVAASGILVDELCQIGGLIDAGAVKPVVDQVFPLAEAREAYETGIHGHPRGKIVLRI